MGGGGVKPELYGHPDLSAPKIAFLPFASDFFAADEGIAGNSAARIIFYPFFIAEKYRGFASDFFAEEVAHLGASNWKKGKEPPRQDSAPGLY